MVIFGASRSLDKVTGRKKLPIPVYLDMNLKLKISFSEILFQRKPPQRHQFYCFNWVIKKKLFIKMKNVYYRGLQKSINDEVINLQKQSFRCSSKQVSFRISQILQENTCVGVFFSNVAGLKACIFLKKRLRHRCFPVKFAKFLRTPQGAIYEFCVRIVSASKYIIISNQCIKVNV